MTTKSEFAAANEAFLAEDRTKAGPPPTAEEMLDFMRGKLPAEESNRIRERLIAYPELVRTLTAQFPEGAEPGDPDYLTDHEFARHRAALEKRLVHRDGARGLLFWRGFGAIAAMIALGFGVMFWRAEVELKKPHAIWRQDDLRPDGQRGLGDKSNELAGAGESYLLVPAFSNDRPFEKYRAEIVDAADPQRILWHDDVVRRSADDSLVILVGREFLKPGKYQLRLYGINGARQEPLSTYTIRVAEH
jgi:hypothetical protein